MTSVGMPVWKCFPTATTMGTESSFRIGFDVRSVGSACAWRESLVTDDTLTRLKTLYEAHGLSDDDYLNRIAVIVGAIPSILKELWAGRELRDSLTSHPHEVETEKKYCEVCDARKAYDAARAETERRRIREDTV